MLLRILSFQSIRAPYVSATNRRRIRRYVRVSVSMPPEMSLLRSASAIRHCATATDDVTLILLLLLLLLLMMMMICLIGEIVLSGFQWRIQGGQSGHTPLPQSGHGIHCGQLILRKISKIGTTRCQILRHKCTKFDFRYRLHPRPRWASLQRSQTP